MPGGFTIRSNEYESALPDRSTGILLLENGTSVILHIGESNSITGDYYLQVSGDDTVYTVSSSLVSTFEKTPEDFVEEETETETETETEAETETATEN